MNSRMLRSVMWFISGLLVWGIAVPAVGARALPESSHWAFPAMSKWQRAGVVTGYADGTLRPDGALTRAEWAELMVRLMGYDAGEEARYTDVRADAWYAKAVARATAAGLMEGTGGKFMPDAPVSRQEAAVVLSRAFRLEAKDVTVLDEFADGHQAAEWSRSALAALIENGYMTGYPQHALMPGRQLTRSEAIALIDRIAGEPISAPGTYTGDRAGNVTVRSSDVVLRDMTVSGDLHLTPGIGDGDVRLDNVTVAGKTIIQGGGERSIVITDTRLQGPVLVHKADGRIRLAAEGSSLVPLVQAYSGVILDNDAADGAGFRQVSVADIADGQTVQVDGSVEHLELLTSVNLTVNSGIIGRLVVSGPSTIALRSGTVTELETLAPAEVTGEGGIGKAIIRSEGVRLARKPDTLELLPGLSADVAGQRVDASSAVSPASPAAGGGGGGGTDTGNGGDPNEAEPFELNGIGEAGLDAIPKETNLTRWDIPWGGTPTNSFFRLSGEPAPSEVIWRGSARGSSTFGDAVWGLIMDAREGQEDDEPAAFIYNKTDLSARAKALHVVARTNPGDAQLSGRGAIRVKAVYKTNGQYEAVTLQPQLTDAQLGDTAASFAVTADGWATFEAPPLVDQSDTFSFDISALAGRSDVVFFIEVNDRMEPAGNLTDRVIVLAVRIREGSLPGPETIMGLTQEQLLSLPKETDRGRWDIAWGPNPVSTFFNLSGQPAPDAVIWRGEAFSSGSFGDAGYGLIMDAREDEPDDSPGTLIYNKTDLAMNASKLQLVARSSAPDPVLSGRGAIRVQAAYKQNGAYVVTPLQPELSAAQLQDGQAQFAVTPDGWVTFEAPPGIDVSDSFFFDLLPVAGRADVILFIETNDRPESAGNRTDRVILLAVRVQSELLEEAAQIVDTQYATEELVIADVVAKPELYDVDPTGEQDSTAGIRQALRDAFAAGGGTVFLPVGTYRVTGNLTIPPFTALRGDYQDPDLPGFDGEYGTVILADVASRDTNFPSLFTVGGSAAVIGVTVYYPNQDAGHIKPYPYTFEIPSFAGQYGHGDHMAPTIKNVTMINAYRGIAASITVKGDLISAANEMLHLENIKGTVLYRGTELYNSSEYGVVRQLSFGNRYWAEADAEWNPPAKAVLDAFTLEHGIGMLMGDLEWVQFTDISLADYKLGVRLFDGLRRHIPGQPEIYFIGQFHRLEVRNAVTGVRIDNLYPDFGITIADSYIEGSLYAIRNEDPTPSVVKLIGTELNGDVGGSDILQTAGSQEYAAMKANGELPDTAAPALPVPPRRLFHAVLDYGADRYGATDSAGAIQAALDAAGVAGGGVVYLPAGFYKVGSALHVPAHTELRGSAASAQRDEIGLSRGTVILADYGYTVDETTAATADALITLAGEAAGVRGLRLFYPDNEPNTVNGAVRPHAYSIRGTADSNYVTHVSLAGSTFGIEFKGTEEEPLVNPIVRGVSGTYYRVGIRLAHTSNGYIDEALANATVVARSGLGLLFPQLVPPSWPSDENGKLTRLYDTITRPNTIFIQAQDADHLTIGHSFTFGSHTFLQAEGSDIRVFNSAGDNLQPVTGKLFDLNDSSLTGVNLMRYQGQSVSAVNSDVTLFNRLSLRDIGEWNVVSGAAVASTPLSGIVKPGDDLPEPYEYVPVHEVLNGIDNARLDATPGETNLSRWDIAWGGTPTGSFFDLNGTAPAQAAIWRGGLSGGSVFADAGWGLIMNAYETEDNDQPGAFIYNKTALPASAAELQVIARSNPSDAHLSGRGALRVRAAYRETNGMYAVVTLPVALSAAQINDTNAQFAQNEQGWVTFEVPPTADVSDSFRFDISELAGKSEVVFFIESNDRMESGGNLADRVIVLAVRIL